MKFTGPYLLSVRSTMSLQVHTFSLATAAGTTLMSALTHGQSAWEK